MKKIVSTLALFGLAAILVVTGLFAAKSISFEVTSTITFKADSVFVSYYGYCRGYDGSSSVTADFGSSTELKYTYTPGGSNKPKAAGTLGDWTIGTVVLSEDANFVITMVFKNEGNLDTTISILSLAADDDFTASYVIEAKPKVDLVKGERTLASVIAAGETVTFTYTVIQANNMVPFRNGTPTTFGYTVTMSTPA